MPEELFLDILVKFAEIIKMKTTMKYNRMCCCMKKGRKVFFINSTE